MVVIVYNGSVVAKSLLQCVASSDNTGENRAF